MEIEHLKIIASDKIQTLSLNQLDWYKHNLNPDSKLYGKVCKQIEYKKQDARDYIKRHYQNSVGGVSLEKYREAKQNGTLKTIHV